MAMGGISDEAIQERAYHIWVREGRPHGRDFEHWVQAQVELEAEQRASNGNGAVAPKAKAKAAAPRSTPPRAPAPKAKVAAKPGGGAAKKKKDETTDYTELTLSPWNPWFSRLRPSPPPCARPVPARVRGGR